MNKNKRKFQKGFTLIEILLILAIASISFTAIYLLYASAIKYDLESRYEIIASNLAQEGVEIIQNARDENILEGNSMNDGLSGVCYPYINETTGEAFCGSGRSAEVGLDSDGYQNCGASCNKTTFRRECDISGDNEEMEVVCTVSWGGMAVQGRRRSVEATTTLTNWMEL